MFSFSKTLLHSNPFVSGHFDETLSLLQPIADVSLSRAMWTVDKIAISHFSATKPSNYLADKQFGSHRLLSIINFTNELNVVALWNTSFSGELFASIGDLDTLEFLGIGSCNFRWLVSSTLGKKLRNVAF